ncbi:hypothetical protein LINPERHAP2_LOCUS25673 [Linum perenne]
MQNGAEDIWRRVPLAIDAETALRTPFMSSGIASWHMRFGLFSSLPSSLLISFQVACRLGSEQVSSIRILSSPLVSPFGSSRRRAMRQFLRINLRHAISSAYESFIGLPGFERQ